MVDLPLWRILVSWDDEIPNIWKNKGHVPNQQPEDNMSQATLNPENFAQQPKL